MKKDKLMGEDGSEFTVFYLSEQNTPKWGVEKFGYNKDENNIYLTGHQAKGIVEDDYPKFKDIFAPDGGKPFELDKPFSKIVPSFDFPFEKKEEIVLNDTIEKDIIYNPADRAIYKLGSDMKVYRFLGEKVATIDDISLSLWALVDVQGHKRFVEAQDNTLYLPTAKELDDFLQ